jgi:carbohydrate-selective porin OprB
MGVVGQDKRPDRRNRAVNGASHADTDTTVKLAFGVRLQLAKAWGWYGIHAW